MVDFVMFPFLISGDFSVWLLQQEIEWTDFLTFTKVSFIDVDLRAENPWKRAKVTLLIFYSAFNDKGIDSLFFRYPFIKSSVEPFIVNIVFIQTESFVVPPLNDFSRVCNSENKVNKHHQLGHDIDDATSVMLTPRVFSSFHQIVFTDFQRRILIFPLVFVSTFIIFLFRLTSFLRRFIVSFSRLKSFNRHIGTPENHNNKHNDEPPFLRRRRIATRERLVHAKRLLVTLNPPSSGQKI